MAFFYFMLGIKTIARWILLHLKGQKRRVDGSCHPFLDRASTHCMLAALDDSVQVLRKNLNAANNKVCCCIYILY